MQTSWSRCARLACLALLCLACGLVRAQRPADPASSAYPAADDLREVANPLAVPAGMVTGAPTGVAFDKQGHLWVLYRGALPLVEFGGDGRFIRGFGAGLFVMPHGLKIDPDGNIWATDLVQQVVYKMNTRGRVLLKLGTEGRAGVIDEPNDVAFGAGHEIFIAQGHTPGAQADFRIAKFDRAGKFVKSWGGSGSGPGQFLVPHGIAVDPKGRVWVADRENHRVQIFDRDGNYLREVPYTGWPCALQIGKEQIYMVNGYAGQVLRLDLEGQVLAATGKPGTGPDEIGEAHAVAVGARGEVWVADSRNSVVHKFVRRKAGTCRRAPPRVNC